MTESGWYNTLLMRGGTRNTYVTSLLLCDFIIYVIFSQGLYLTNLILGVKVAGWQSLIWTFTLAQMLYCAV